MDFVAVDVETANEDLASICQIGVATFEGGKPKAAWATLVDPQEEFAGINVAIHGIDEEDVAGAPTLPEVYDRLHAALCGNVVVCHTAFDRTSFRRAQAKYSLSPIECRWLDSARVARRAWPQFAQRGYGLANVAQECGIDFRHHDALEDARACGEILVRAIQVSGLSMEGWFDRLKCKESSQIARQGDGDGPLVGELVVFTGSLSLPRARAADLAAEAGADVANTVTKNTTLLVVGDQDIRRLAGHEKSSKHRKAETLIRGGAALRIVTESDFQQLIAN